MALTPREIMDGFALRTGLESPGGPSIRYLWTDAFAVCNFLGLYVEEKDPRDLQRALRLIDETHRVLGRHRLDDSRQGWISGLDDAVARQHPTAGGLRIGKPLPERRPDERHDAAGEWDRDGQYFHYLTKWMQALESASRVTKEPDYHRWAVELARTAFARFAVRDSSGSLVGLRWKLSVDLTRPLVPSMGQHDALDGFVTFSRLAGREGIAATSPEFELRREVADLAALCVGRDWTTDDSLGLGGLLCDAYALAKLMDRGVLDEPELLEGLLEASRSGLAALVEGRGLEQAARARLPFRELGLTIGLRALQRLAQRIEGMRSGLEDRGSVRRSIGALARHSWIVTSIESFWQQRENRASPTWTGHREINEVMLATSLAPDGYLETG